MADLVGSKTAETLVGTEEADSIDGKGGADTIEGRGGDDALNGGPGWDSVDGGEGADTIDGGAGSDDLFGQSGADLVFGRGGDDLLDGGDGADLMVGGSGNDHLKGRNDADDLDGGSGRDIINGGRQDDVLRGRLGKDVLKGLSGDDILRGGAQRDEVVGGQGNDDVKGGGGADQVFGSYGDDTLAGGSGDDFIDGGPGQDVAVYRGVRRHYSVRTEDDVVIVQDTATTLAGDDGLDRVINVERLLFSDRTTIADGSNAFPELGDNVALKVVENSVPVALVFEKILDPDGDTLEIAVLEVPDPTQGHILTTGDVALVVDDTLELAELVRLEFEPVREAVGPAGTFTYRVDDGDQGTAEQSFVFEIQALPPGSLVLASMKAEEGLILEGAARDDEAGIAVSGAGDMNGDGFGEVVVGARSADPNGEASGTAYVFHGRAEPPPTAVDLGTLPGRDGLALFGALEGDRAGISVAGGGDTDGDGLAEVVIGVRGSDIGGLQAGAGYVVYGEGDPPAEIELDDLDDGQGGGYFGGHADDFAGRSVAVVGDVNGDGFHDVLIGAAGTDVEGDTAKEDAGVAYLIFGSSQRSPISNDLVGLAYPQGVQLLGANPRDSAAYTVAAAGDVNGDGLDDVILGAHFADPNGSRSGAAYVVYGSATFGSNGSVELGALDGSDGFVLTGAAADDRAGQAVSTAGDFNGDGYDDLVVGAPFADAAGTDSGQAYVIFGGANVGLSGRRELSSLSGSDGFRVMGVAPGDLAGAAVAAAGDVDADGYDDVVLGARDADSVGNASGEAYVLYGRPQEQTVALLDLFMMDEADGLILRAGSEGDLTGIAVGGAGDVNGDGFADVVVGASGARGGGQRGAGVAYVLFGDDFRGQSVIEGGADDDVLDGTGTADRIVGGAGDDVLNGVGGPDILRGGSGDDLLVPASTGFLLIDGGSGVDTVRLPAGTVLDLTTSPPPRINAVEAFHLAGTESGLVVDARGVAGLSSTSNRLVIDGQEGNTVTLSDGGWSAGDPVEITGTTFALYTNGAAELLVAEGLSVVFGPVAAATSSTVPMRLPSGPANASFPIGGLLDLLLPMAILTAMAGRYMRRLRQPQSSG